MRYLKLISLHFIPSNLKVNSASCLQFDSSAGLCSDCGHYSWCFTHALVNTLLTNTKSPTLTGVSVLFTEVCWRNQVCVCVCVFRSHSLLYFWWHWFCCFHSLFCISGYCTCFFPTVQTGTNFWKKEKKKMEGLYLYIHVSEQL